MKNLTKYIENQNRFATLFKSKQYDADNLSSDDLKALADRLASDLSPEALTCDGELRGARLITKARFLNSVKADLEAKGVTVSDY